MCGRYSIITTIQEIAENYGVENLATNFTPNLNIATGESAPVITSENYLKRQFFTFGFTPF